MVDLHREFFYDWVFEFLFPDISTSCAGFNFSDNLSP